MLDKIMISLTFVMIFIVGFCFFCFIREQKTILKNSLRMLLTIFLINSIGFGCLLLTNHYSIDSFNLLFDLGAYWQLMLGRYLNCGIFLLIDKLDIDLILSQQPFALIWFALLCISEYIIVITIKNILNAKNNILIIIITSLSFLNVFMMEWMLFPEMFLVSGIGILSLSLSIYYFLCCKYRCRCLLTFVLLILALGNYQSYIGVFEAYVLVGSFVQKNNSAERFRNYFYSLLIGGVASLFNVIQNKMLVYFGIISDSGRGVSGLNIHTVLKNIKEIILYQLRFWTDSDGLLPGIWMTLWGIALLFLLIVTIKKVGRKIELIFLVFLILALSFAPHIIEANILLRPRSNIAIWSTLSALIILILFLLGNERIWRNSIWFLSSSMVLINTIFVNDIACNTRTVNCADFLEADQIVNKIKNYEEESGKQISKIAVCYDSRTTLYHSFSKYKNGELGARILATDYSGYRLIGYKLGRDLNKIQASKNIEEYFLNKDWTYLDINEQILLVDDVIYYCVY